MVNCDRRGRLDDDLIIITAGLLLHKLIKRNRKPKRWHVRPYYLDRRNEGRYIRDIPKLREDPELFKETFRMSTDQFDALFLLLKPELSPVIDTRPLDKILPKERLYMTLEFLASGTLLRHMACIYRCGKTTVQTVVIETCRAITRVLKPLNMKLPTKSEWLEISNEFNMKWNLPNCVGAIDGKHVAIRSPDRSGSIFYCHKLFHSIILMAVAGPDYRFIIVNAGAYGSEGDSTAFRTSKFGDLLLKNKLDLPPPMSIFGKLVPFYFVADDAFPLCQRIMKPFSLPRGKTCLDEEERIFNNRLSRSRRCVENAFGILCARWYCLARSLPTGPDAAQDIVDATCVLHNYLIKKSGNYCPQGFADTMNPDGSVVEGKWREMAKQNSSSFRTISHQTAGRPTSKSVELRNHLKAFVNSDQGALKWQR